MDSQQHGPLRATGVIVDGRERPSRSLWWLLALMVTAATALSQRDAITRWLVPREQAVIAALKSSMDSGHTPASHASNTASTLAMQRALDASAEPPSLQVDRPIATDPPLPVAQASQPASVSIQPLYPATAPASVPGPEGKAGLVAAMRAGTLRLATATDIASWETRYQSTHGQPPGREFEDGLRMFDAYSIQGDLTLPGGLTGAHAVVFLLDAGMPYPRGDAGHSIILDLASGTCVGALCRTLLPSQ